MAPLKYWFGVLINSGQLVTCLTAVILMTILKSFVKWFHDSVLVSSGVSIYGYQLQPDMPVAVHVLLLAVGMFVPAMTGLFLTCKRGTRKMKVKLRVCHVVFQVIGIVIVSVLFFAQAAKLYETVDCWLDYGNCVCDTAATSRTPVSNNVCACRDVRIAYFTFVSVGLVLQILSLLHASKLLFCSCCGGPGAAKGAVEPADNDENSS